jgi:hypothetical protein
LARNRSGVDPARSTERHRSTPTHPGAPGSALNGAEEHQAAAGAQVDDVLVAAQRQPVEHPVTHEAFAAQ